MIKSELITSMSKKSGLTKRDCESALLGFIESVEETLEKGEKVQLVGFGAFETRVKRARLGRNPKTQEVIQIEEKVVPVFKAGEPFKEKIKIANK
jgi:DNA-binding protein HU-beta